MPESSVEEDYQYVESLQSFKPTDYSQFQGKNPGQDDITYEDIDITEDVDTGKGRRGGKVARKKSYRAMTGCSILTQYGLYGTVREVIQTTCASLYL